MRQILRGGKGAGDSANQAISMIEAASNPQHNAGGSTSMNAMTPQLSNQMDHDMQSNSNVSHQLSKDQIMHPTDNKKKTFSKEIHY